MGDSRTELILDIVGTAWVVVVVVVFLGLPYGLPEVSVSVLERVYALCLIGAVVWLARRATSSGCAKTIKGAKERD